MPTFRTLLAAGLGIACLGAPMRTAAQIKTEQEKWCPVWASSPLPEARQGQPYSASLGSNILACVSAVQTMPPLPAMPAGLTLAGDKVQGTPTVAGYASFTIQLSVLYPCPGFGMVVGLLAGGTAGGLVGAVTHSPCVSRGYGCLLAPSSRLRSAEIGAALVGTLGFVAGGIAGFVSTRQDWKPLALPVSIRVAPAGRDGVGLALRLAAPF